MTGQEFRAAIKRLGLTQTSLAKLLRCDRGTIIARCNMETVDVQHRYIMLGLLAEKAANDLIMAVKAD